MKHYLILFMTLLLVPGSLVAKKKKDENPFFEDDAFFDISEVPDRWQNESGVILAQKSIVSIKKIKRRAFMIERSNRVRIFLTDDAAVEQYSEFYFSPSDDFGIRITKPSGIVIDVDLEEAIDVEQGISIPAYYRNSFMSGVSKKKLAIQNLEKGDIIEIASRSYDRDGVGRMIIPNSGMMPLGFYTELTSQTYNLSSTYPKVKHDLEFLVDDRLYFNFKAINKAPRLQEDGVDEKDKHLKKYSIRIRNQEKIKDERFSYPDRTYAKIKYQVLYIHKGREPRTPYFHGERPGEIHNSLTEEDIKRVLYLDILYGGTTSTSALLLYKRFGKKMSAADPETFMKAYYEKMQAYYCADERSDYRISNSEFVRCFVYALWRKKVDFDIIFTVPKTEGRLEDLLTTDDLVYAVRIKKKNSFNYTYFYPFAYYSTPDDMNYTMAGEKGYAFTFRRKYENCTMQEVDFDEYGPSDNVTDVKVTASIKRDFGALKISQSTTCRGEHKTSEASQILLRDDYEWKNPMPVPTTIGPTAQQNRYEKHVKELLERRRIEGRESELNGDFEVSKYKDFKLVDAGMNAKKNELKFTDKFEVTDLIKTAGDSTYIVEIGKLISGQVALQQDEYERENDVYVNYPRTFSYRLVLNIPADFGIMNIDHLNRRVETKAGLFESKAELKDGKLVVTTTKEYRATFLRAAEWNQMVLFLDEAFAFQNTKVVLVK